LRNYCTLEDFAPEERTSAVKLLLGICHRQQEEIIALRGQVVQQAEQIALQSEQIQLLKDEISRLKGEKGRPNIKPSTLNKTTAAGDGASSGQQRGKPSDKKTHKLKIHHTRKLEPQDLPAGSKFKGYEKYVVQDIEINLNNTLYLRARYLMADGKTVIGELPAAVVGSH